MNVQPYSYQNDAIEWMVQRETDKSEKFFGGILADEVGLGKTMMMTGTMLKNPKKNTLIILPKSLLLQWKAELEKYTDSFEIHLPQNDEIEMNEDSSISRIHIVSHSRFNKRGIEDPAKLSYCNQEWDRIVIDEAHIIKNKKSKIHKAVTHLKSNIRWALTATPIMNKMTDFVYTMKWVSQDHLSQLDCQTTKDSITEKYIMRRTKEDVKEENEKFELPPCHIEVNKLNFLTEEEKTLYSDKYREMQSKIRELKNALGNQSVIYILELLLRARQICTHPDCYIDGMNKKEKKTQKLLGKNAELLNENRLMENWPTNEITKLKFVKEKLASQPKEDKTLIFCHFIKEIDSYHKELTKEGYNVSRIDGRIELEDRNQIVENFKTDDSKQILLIQINVGGQGLNLQCANRIIITSPTWNPALQHQVIGRAHRTGQKKEVFVNILTIANEDSTQPYVEEKIMEIQKVKRNLMAHVLNDERLKNLETDESITEGSKLSFKEVTSIFKTKLK